MKTAYPSSQYIVIAYQPLQYKVITNNMTNVGTNRYINVGLGIKLVPDTIRKIGLESP